MVKVRARVSECDIAALPSPSELKLINQNKNDIFSEDYDEIRFTKKGSSFGKYTFLEVFNENVDGLGDIMAEYLEEHPCSAMYPVILSCYTDGVLIGSERLHDMRMLDKVMPDGRAIMFSGFTDFISDRVIEIFGEIFTGKECLSLNVDPIVLYQHHFANNIDPLRLFSSLILLLEEKAIDDSVYAGLIPRMIRNINVDSLFVILEIMESLDSTQLALLNKRVDITIETARGPRSPLEWDYDRKYPKRWRGTSFIEIIYRSILGLLEKRNFIDQIIVHLKAMSGVSRDIKIDLLFKKTAFGYIAPALSYGGSLVWESVAYCENISETDRRWFFDCIKEGCNKDTRYAKQFELGIEKLTGEFGSLLTYNARSTKKHAKTKREKGGQVLRFWKEALLHTGKKVTAKDIREALRTRHEPLVKYLCNNWEADDAGKELAVLFRTGYLKNADDCYQHIADRLKEKVFTRGDDGRFSSQENLVDFASEFMTSAKARSFVLGNKGEGKLFPLDISLEGIDFKSVDTVKAILLISDFSPYDLMHYSDSNEVKEYLLSLLVA